MSRTRVKICGVRDEATIRAAVDAGADALGFVFVKDSPRAIQPRDAWRLVSALPTFVTSVGLFRNASIEEFCDVEQTCPTALSQLHGTEPPNLVRDCGPGVIKSVRFHPETIRAELDRWDGVEEVDAILIDGSAGGEGTSFEWEALRPHLEGFAKPVIIAGGLNPDNVGDAIRTLRPFAVDVSTGVERERGVKDPDLIRAFCRAVQEADRARSVTA
ncbi:MAG: phosphoribosylanthranilate isomerase [Phycisphaeraceae bacterium]|nr:phosphoribosylanthranilate isomerase [Phycisphaeraceae bacterium]